jgi:hypothetical protein
MTINAINIVKIFEKEKEEWDFLVFYRFTYTL